MSNHTLPHRAEPAGGVTVVGVDRTPESAAALRWALGDSRRSGADVRAISVWLPAAATLGPGAVPVIAGAPELLDDREASARRLLAETVARSCEEAEAPPDAVDARVLTGDPADVLLRASVDAALLVLGNARRGPLAGALTSSVGYRCAHHARCPVVLVPTTGT